MSENNWRIPTDAGDYFSNQKKTLQNESRRPVVRRASDLVGPAINKFTARVADYNSALVAVNGFVSSLPGALNAPPETLGSGTFVGTISTDAERGGTQDLTELGTGIKWSRQFSRNPTDPDLLIFTSWVAVFEPASSWVPITLASGFAPATFGFTPAVRLKGPDIWLRGNIQKSSGNIVANETLGTIPVGYRPGAVSYGLLPGTGSQMISVQFNANGTIVTRGAFVAAINTSSWCSLDGVKLDV